MSEEEEGEKSEASEESEDENLQGIYSEPHELIHEDEMYNDYSHDDDLAYWTIMMLSVNICGVWGKWKFLFKL